MATPHDWIRVPNLKALVALPPLTPGAWVYVRSVRRYYRVAKPKNRDRWGLVAPTPEVQR